MAASPSGSTTPHRPLTPKQARFVEEYLLDLNATQAATRAGYSPRTANEQGARLLAYASIRDAVSAAQATRAHRLQITADDLVRQWWTIATTDPNELIQYRRVCCRYCYGTAHEYQRTRAELQRDRRKWDAAQTKSSKDTFDEQGGDGYNATKPPHPACPECFGEGLGDTHVLDTRALSPAARLLYAGVKQTKDGLEVKLHSQHDARVEVGKLLGYYAEKTTAPDASDVARAVREAMRAMDAADGLDAAA